MTGYRPISCKYLSPLFIIFTASSFKDIITYEPVFITTIFCGRQYHGKIQKMMQNMAPSFPGFFLVMCRRILFGQFLFSHFVFYYTVSFPICVDRLMFFTIIFAAALFLMSFVVVLTVISFLLDIFFLTGFCLIVVLARVLAASITVSAVVVTSPIAVLTRIITCPVITICLAVCVVMSVSVAVGICGNGQAACQCECCQRNDSGFFPVLKHNCNSSCFLVELPTCFSEGFSSLFTI